MRNIILLSSFCFLFSCNAVKKQKSVERNEIVELENDEIKVYNFKELEPLLKKQDDKIYVINFWATWCAPCVKELPYFEKIKENYKDENVEVLLVSLDFPDQYETKLKPFVKQKKLKSKVIALDDIDMNTWIPKVDKEWSGALPATYIYHNNESKFFEQSFTYKSLEKEIKLFIK